MQKGESQMISLMINMVLRALAVFLTGFVSAVLGFIAGSMVFIIFGFEFNGRQGYEAGGPIGFILGALIGLVGSGVWLFGRRTKI